MFKQLSILSLVTAVCVNAMDLTQHGIIKINNVRSKDSIDLYHSPNGFAVVKGSDSQPVNPCLIDPMLRKMNQQQLKQFQKHGYIDITQMSDSNFALRAKVRGNGGFLLTGVIVYNTLKYTGYVAYGAGSTGAIATGFVTGGPLGAAGAYAGALAALPTAAAGIESGALMIGTAASFIPGLP